MDVTLRQFWENPSWWKLGKRTILWSSAIAMMGASIVLMLMDDFTVDPISGIGWWMLGILIFGVPTWCLGIAVGALVWPPVWRYAKRLRWPDRQAAALAAFGVAIIGGVVPWGILALRDPDSVFVIVAAAAIVSTLVGPTLAYFRFEAPDLDEIFE